MKKTAILLSILSAVTLVSSTAQTNKAFAETQTEVTAAAETETTETTKTTETEEITKEASDTESAVKTDAEKMEEIDSVGCKVYVSFKNPVDISKLRITESSKFDVKVEGVPQSDITIRMVGYPLDLKPKSVFINLENVKYLDNSYNDETVKLDNRQAYLTYKAYSENQATKTYALNGVFVPSTNILAVKLDNPGSYSIVKTDKTVGKTLGRDNELIDVKTTNN